MDVALWLVVGAALALGLLGTVVPFLPGTPLIALGALIYAAWTGWAIIGPGRLAILVALAGTGYLLHYVAGALGARHAGSSPWGMVGALLGGIVGLFFGVPGLLLGPLLGAIVGELLKTGDLRLSIRTGVAAFIGMMAGALANVAVAVTMIGLFVWWVVRG
jgi:uncharacterized protein